MANFMKEITETVTGTIMTITTIGMTTIMDTSGLMLLRCYSH